MPLKQSLDAWLQRLGVESVERCADGVLWVQYRVEAS